MSEFIRTHTELILEDWEQFARSISPNPGLTASQLRDNAENMLEAIADDMDSEQSERERHEKSQGEECSSGECEEVDTESKVHARERAHSGFDLVEMVSEYRALRASVTRRWYERGPADTAETREDLRRFHEAIDQSMDMAIRHYAQLVDRSRQIFLAMLGHDLRNPLCAIGINASLLTEPGRSDLAEIGKDIASCVRAMQGIIQDLLTYAGGSLGATIPVTKRDADMGVLVREVVREAQTNCSSCTIRVGDLAGDLSG
ncbi:MAG: RsbRD N-terminal domain-containing protein [Phycisphaerales bacterium]|nr:sensor histidine kinase [Planctomycetota bacterium]MCH8509338.1 RsbRD N-terminal domain-containing protein [Phycisphaerales bacterium]